MRQEVCGRMLLAPLLLARHAIPVSICVPGQFFRKNVASAQDVICEQCVRPSQLKGEAAGAWERDSSLIPLEKLFTQLAWQARQYLLSCVAQSFAFLDIARKINRGSSVNK
jgi:hypothetical protein